jgi:hypothetical protein
LEAGTWLLTGSGDNTVASATTISFSYPFTLRYNITSASQTFAGADTYFDYKNITFQTSINQLPSFNASVVVKPTSTTNYFITCSPLYGNGASTSGGTNMVIGSNIKFQATRIA